MPWVNVVANEQFGFLVSERGAAHTWSQNSREHRLTPWSNDPVSDPVSEAIYIRDDDTGRHTHRVARQSALIAEALGAGDRFVEHRPARHLLDVLPEVADGELAREGDVALVWLLFDQGLIPGMPPGIDQGNLPAEAFWAFFIDFSVIWFIIWLWTNGPMRVPLIRGRLFTERDGASGPQVTIVDWMRSANRLMLDT